MTFDCAAARWEECQRRMVAAGISQSQFAFHDAAYMKAVIADEQAGLWSPDTAEADAPASAPASAAPAAFAPVLAPVADPAIRSRSIWSKAATEANAELGHDDPLPVDPKGDATPAGSVARTRSMWGKAVTEANTELVRRGGRIGEA